MTNTKIILLGLTSMLCSSACTTLPTQFEIEHRAAVDEANNKQIVSTTALKGAPVRHPALSAAAIDRYLAGEVEELEEEGSFNSGGGGG